METNEKKSYWREPLLVFGRISGWIVAPIIGALFLGRWLDGKFGTKPWLFLATTAIAFIITVIGIMKEVNKYLETIKNKNGKPDTK